MPGPLRLYALKLELEDSSPGDMTDPDNPRADVLFLAQLLGLLEKVIDGMAPPATVCAAPPKEQEGNPDEV